MKRKFITVLLALFFLFPLIGGEYVHSTEHFDFIFSDETRESAAEVIEKAEDYYSRLVEIFKCDPEMRIPVYFKSDTKDYNAYYTAYPANHIVMYVTSLPSTLLTNADYPLSLTFFHELTHAFTHSIKSPFVSFLSSVFGDGVIPGNLYMNRAFIEGIAVYAESLEGEGRLNDPKALYLVNQMAAEEIKLTYLDIEGGRDIFPGGNMSYILGASFLSYLSSTYGEDKLTSFIKKCYEFPISTPALIFKSIFGLRLRDAWSDYVSSKSLKREVKSPRTITSRGKWADLKLKEGKVYVTDQSRSGVYELSPTGEKKRIKLTSSSFDDFSLSSSYYLLTFVCENERSVSIFNMEGKRIRTFGGYYSGLLLSDERVLLLTEDDRNTRFDLYSLTDGEKMSSILLGRDVTLWSGVTLSENEGLFLLSQGGRTGLLLVDTEEERLTKLAFPDDITLSSLSLNSDGTIAFSYVTDDVSSFMKYGEIKRDGNIWSYRISSDEYNGGIYYPVRDGSAVYFVSSFFSGKKVSTLSLSELTFTIEGVLEPLSFVPRVMEKSGEIESVVYNPLLFIDRGLLLPLGYSSVKTISSLSGLGLTYIVQDPAEKHKIVLSLGYEPVSSAPFSYLSYSFREYFKADLFSFYRNGKTAVEFDFTFSYKKTFSSDNRYLLLSDTVSLSKDDKTGVNNYFSLSYIDLYKAGFGRHENLGWGGKIGLRNLTPTFTLALYIPRLLPFEGNERMTLSIPFNAAFSVTGIEKTILFWNLDFYLFTYEVQSSVSFLALYLQNIDVVLSSYGELRPCSMAFSDRYSLSVNLGLAPLVGILSVLSVELKVGVSYDRSKTSFSFLFDIT